MLHLKISNQHRALSMRSDITISVKDRQRGPARPLEIRMEALLRKATGYAASDWE